MNGVYGVGRAICDSVYLARELATAQRVVLAKVGATDLTCDELRGRFDYQLEGVAPLRAIVAWAPRGAICVEAIPALPSLVEQPVAVAKRGTIALALARIVARAHGRGIPLIGLRPELVFVGEDVTIAPRWARFLGHDEDPRADVLQLGRSIAQLWPDRPGEIDALVRTMTMRDPARRPLIAEVIYALTCARVRRAS